MTNNIEPQNSLVESLPNDSLNVQIGDRGTPADTNCIQGKFQPVRPGFLLGTWISDIRNISLEPKDRAKAYIVVAKMIAELSYWIGDSRERAEEVASLIGIEGDVNVWGPMLFAIARSNTTARKELIISIMNDFNAPRKSWYAAIAALDCADPKGNALLPGFIDARIGEIKDPKLAQVAARIALDATDPEMKFWLTYSLQYSIRDNNVVRALTSIFISKAEGGRLRELAGRCLSSVANENSEVMGAARLVLGDRTNNDQALISAIAIIGNNRSTESAYVIGNIIGDSTYPDAVRIKAVKELSSKAEQENTLDYLLQLYANQTKKIRICILESLAESNKADIWIRLQSLPPEEDMEVRKIREKLVARLRGYP